MRAEFKVQPEEARFGARHVLFVEGSGEDGIDTTVLRTLLNDMVRVKPLGGYPGIENAAKALHEYHPTYYFLIDRDHRSPDEADRTWQRFPDPNASNLLIWRRRELENYFIIPDYLARSQYLKCNKAQLKSAIRSAAERRVYLDAANSAIVKLREDLKSKWIELLKPADGCADYATALDRLTKKPEFKAQATYVSSLLSSKAIEELFEATVRELLGSGDEPRWGAGHWLEQVSGKEILNEIIAGKRFIVEDRNGKKLQGKEKLMRVVKDLLRHPIEEQPDDFQELHRLITRQVGLHRDTNA